MEKTCENYMKMKPVAWYLIHSRATESEDVGL